MENQNISISVIDGERKDGKGKWKALKVEIGEWSTVVFPRTRFEMNYIEKIINAKKS